MLALRYSKMICQGRRNDIIEELKKLENPDEIKENSTSGTQCHRTKSRDILGAEYDLKGRAVANYLRINELITPLKRRIDDAEFPIVAAVQLSFLTEQEQQMVDDVLSENEYKVNEGKAVLLREYTGKLTPERTEQILSGEFNRKPKNPRLRRSRSNRRFTRNTLPPASARKSSTALWTRRLPSTLLRKDRSPSKRPDNRP